MIDKAFEVLAFVLLSFGMWLDMDNLAETKDK